jgi:hypothetical protein
MTVPYHEFAQYYAECYDNMTDAWRLYQLRSNALERAGKAVPEDLENETKRQKFIVAILQEAGHELFNKTSNELRKDGKYYRLEKLAKQQNKPKDRRIEEDGSPIN